MPKEKTYRGFWLYLNDHAVLKAFAAECQVPLGDLIRRIVKLIKSDESIRERLKK